MTAGIERPGRRAIENGKGLPERLKDISSFFEVCLQSFDSAKETFSLITCDGRHPEIAEALRAWWDEVYGLEETVKNPNISEKAANLFMDFWEDNRHALANIALAHPEQFPNVFFDMHVGDYIRERAEDGRMEFHYLCQPWFYEDLKNHLIDKGAVYHG